jgi:imidazole glycerol-phosphate synthase subunit HisF
MLKHRIIPIVLLDGFSVLKTIQFESRRNLGSPITVMRTYETRNVDEMIILDIDATRQNRSIDKFVIQEITKDCFMPLTIGGGIKNCKDIEQVLKSGADKVSINNEALKNPKFVSEAVQNFGSQCIVASIDLIQKHKKTEIYNNNYDYSCLNYLNQIRLFEDLGVGELLVCDVDREGTMSGPNLQLATEIADFCSVPLIYSGGISCPKDTSNLIKSAGMSAVGVSSIFHFTDWTPEDCRKSLKATGIAAR